MHQSQRHYELIECEDEHGFLPIGDSFATVAAADAGLQEWRALFPHAFIVEVVMTGCGNRSAHGSLMTM